MTPNKNIHILCGSNGDGTQASLHYSYSHAGDSFTVWPSTVVKSKCSVGARTWCMAKTISSLALVFTPSSNLEVYQDSATASQPIYSYSRSHGNLSVSLSPSLSFGQVGQILLSQLQLRNQASSATSGHFGHHSSELSPLFLSLPGNDSLKPSCLLATLSKQHTS